MLEQLFSCVGHYLLLTFGDMGKTLKELSNEIEATTASTAAGK
jgi:hypothetical protein